MPTNRHVSQFRVGIIGGGFMAAVHSRAVRDAGGELCAVASSSAGSAARAAHALAAQRFESDPMDLIAAPDIDVVHICTPNSTHATFARLALESGKHVVCEKPLATSSQEASELSRVAREKGSVAAVPFVYRYHPMVREARERVRAGELGQLLSVSGAYLQDWMLSPEDDDWRARRVTGGPSRAFADVGSHLVDLIEFVAGERIETLTARDRRVFATRGGIAVDTEDLVALTVETQSGALGSVLVSQMAAGRKNALAIELHGSRETLRFEQERPEELWRGLRNGSQLLMRDPATASSDAARIQTLPAGHPTGYQDAFNAFMADVFAAIDGREPIGLPTFADGERAVRVTEAVLQSSKSGQWALTDPRMDADVQTGGRKAE